jgi:hypothetical protein
MDKLVSINSDHYSQKASNDARSEVLTILLCLFYLLNKSQLTDFQKLVNIKEKIALNLILLWENSSKLVWI